MERIEEREKGADEIETKAAKDVELARADADARCLEMDLQCNELRRRAEKAEHALAEARPPGLANGTGTLHREYRERCEELQTTIGEQDRMLNALARVVAARDLGADAQTLAMGVLGVEVHRRLAREWKAREEAKEGQESAPAEPAPEPRKRAVRTRSGKKV